jgi:hypothetical protein
MDKRLEKIAYKLGQKLATLFLFPFFFFVIWNEIMPDVCGFAELTYWQAFFIGLGVRFINGSVSTKLLMNEKFKE